MARPRKQTIDYFPHDTDASEGKTLTIIQAKYGNEGYAFWFKLLQLLGKSPGHYYDFNNHADLEFLCAKTNQKDTETVLDMLNTLVELGAIDRRLHKAKIIWCQKFVDRIEDAYERTIGGVPQRPDFLVSVANNDNSVSKGDQSANSNPQKTTESAQTKINKIKRKEKEKKDTHSQKIWLQALRDLKPQVSKTNFRTWFDKTEGYNFDNGVFTVQVPNRFVAEHLENTQQSLIEKVLINQLSRPVKVAFHYRVKDI